MQTKSDIENGGGKCEVVGTDFWEGTDKDGKIWWCNHEGCVEKPKVMASTGNIIRVPLEIYVVPEKSGGGYHIAVLPGKLSSKT